VLRGRHITVTYAHQAPLDAYTGSGSRRTPQQGALHHHGDAGRPTTLSLLKSAPTARSRYARNSAFVPSSSLFPVSNLSLVLTETVFFLEWDYRTDDKIAQMEAKLLQLAQAPPTGTQPPAPAHPSLPAKPGTHAQSISAPVEAAPAPMPRLKPPLPRVARPQSPPQQPLAVTGSVLHAPSSRKSNAPLKGVKIVRKKDKPKVEGGGEGSS
jgi:hypothetical protein